MCCSSPRHKIISFEARPRKEWPNLELLVEAAAWGQGLLSAVMPVRALDKWGGFIRLLLLCWLLAGLFSPTDHRLEGLLSEFLTGPQW